MPDDDAVDYTELIEQFKRAGQLPIIWQWTARDLVCAANTLRRRREELVAANAPEGASRHATKMPILLLYGLALENLLKGLLVAQGTDATTTGKLNATLKTHDVLRLWRLAGLSLDEPAEDLLKRLHYSIEVGKYPVGTKPDPAAPSPVWVELSSLKGIGELLATAEEALRALQPKTTFAKIDLLALCVE